MSNPQPDRPSEPDPTKDEGPAEVASDPGNAKQPTGEAQAAANRETDPPA